MKIKYFPLHIYPINYWRRSLEIELYSLCCFHVKCHLVLLLLMKILLFQNNQQTLSPPSPQSNFNQTFQFQHLHFEIFIFIFLYFFFYFFIFWRGKEQNGSNNVIFIILILECNPCICIDTLKNKHIFLIIRIYIID